MTSIKNKGFSLIELMVVIAIIGILAAISFGTGTDSGLKARRAIAKTVMMDVQSAQEQYFLNNKSYTSGLDDLGFSGATVYVDERGSTSVAQADSFYLVSATINGLSYTITATAQNTQSKDTGCTTLTLNSSGVKNPADCW